MADLVQASKKIRPSAISCTCEIMWRPNGQPLYKVETQEGKKILRGFGDTIQKAFDMLRKKEDEHCLKK